MAAGNTESVQRAYVALGGDLDDFFAILHPDAEWHWPRGMPDRRVYRGKVEIRRGLDAWAESWADLRIEPVELIERGEGVLAVVRYRARGRASGVEIDERVVHLWEFRDGLVVYAAVALLPPAHGLRLIPNPPESSSVAGSPQPGIWPNHPALTTSWVVNPGCFACARRPGRTIFDRPMRLGRRVPPLPQPIHETDPAPRPKQGRARWLIPRPRARG